MNTIPSPNPYGIQLYDILSVDLVENVDGVWWLEAATACGHRIETVMFDQEALRPGRMTFGVRISKDDREIRSYVGRLGSDAEQVFNGFHKEYFGF
jgi:hypothetical protein